MALEQRPDARGVVINYLNGSVLEQLELDATPTQTHAGENEVTEHPVETGTNIVDHVRVKPDKLTIEGWVTDTPIDDVPPSSVDPSGDAYAQLLAFKAAGQLLTVATTLRTYLNMVITSLSVPRDAKTGAALNFTASFEQIIVVGTQQVNITALLKAQQKKNLGPKTPQLSPTQAADASHLEVASNGLGVTTAGSGVQSP